MIMFFCIEASPHSIHNKIKRKEQEINSNSHSIIEKQTSFYRKGRL